MELHNPYEPLIQELMEHNEVDDEESLIGALECSQEYVERLRAVYSRRLDEDVPPIDYSDGFFRGAYLLTYFPRYIEMIYHILEVLERQRVINLGEWLNQPRVRCSILGGGPLPELLGFAAYLEDNYPGVEKLVVNVFDKNLSYWSNSIGMTERMVPQYCSLDVRVRKYHLDVLDCVNGLDDEQRNRIAKSDLFIMQHCLNESIDPGDNACINRVVENFMCFFELIPSNSLLIISDIIWERVSNLQLEIETAVLNSELGSVLYSVDNGVKSYRSNIQIPDIVAQGLCLSSAPGLVRYKLSVFQRS